MFILGLLIIEDYAKNKANLSMLTILIAFITSGKGGVCIYMSRKSEKWSG